MNAEDQTVMVAIALEDEFGERAVTNSIDFADGPAGKVKVQTQNARRVEEIVEEHADKQDTKHDINLHYNISETDEAVLVRGIHPTPIEE